MGPGVVTWMLTDLYTCSVAVVPVWALGGMAMVPAVALCVSGPATQMLSLWAILWLLGTLLLNKKVC